MEPMQGVVLVHPMMTDMADPVPPGPYRDQSFTSLSVQHMRMIGEAPIITDPYAAEYAAVFGHLSSGSAFCLCDFLSHERATHYAQTWAKQLHIGFDSDRHLAPDPDESRLSQPQRHAILQGVEELMRQGWLSDDPAADLATLPNLLEAAHAARAALDSADSDPDPETAAQALDDALARFSGKSKSGKGMRPG